MITQDLMTMFEKEHRGVGRLDKENKDLWSRGIIYQDGQVNTLFLTYRKGYLLGKQVWSEDGESRMTTAEIVREFEKAGPSPKS